MKLSVSDEVKKDLHKYLCLDRHSICIHAKKWVYISKPKMFGGISNQTTNININKFILETSVQVYNISHCQYIMWKEQQYKNIYIKD